MGSRSVIVIQIRTKDTTEGRFVEHDHVVQALAPNRTNDALDVGPLPGGSRGGKDFLEGVDVVLLEGIFLFKRECCGRYDFRIWIECSFETALKHALARLQEGLPPEETTAAYERIYVNLPSRNSPSSAVALNCGIGSSSLNADVNALERLQIVRGRNSSYFGSKYRSCTVRARCFGASNLPSTNAS